MVFYPLRCTGQRVPVKVRSPVLLDFERGVNELTASSPTVFKPTLPLPPVPHTVRQPEQSSPFIRSVNSHLGGWSVLVIDVVLAV